MSVLFSESGQDNDLAVSSPNLSGDFIPAIDMPTFTDGFGLVTPWGGGATKRNYSPYGVSAENTAQGTQLNDLTSLMGLGGGDLSYNIEGLVGPQGVRGEKGDPGVSGFMMWGQYPTNSNFLMDLPHNIDQINDLGTAADKLVYTSEYTPYYIFEWEKTSVAGGVSSWNESDINDGGSFFIIAADSGIYISVDDGDSWSKSNPDADTYIQVSCAASGGKAIALGDAERENGTIWVTSDYGANWTEKTVGAE